MFFQSNALGSFNTYTPNIDLTIAPEKLKDIDSYTLRPGEGITIASTGKTANYYIDKLTMNSIPINSGNALSTPVTSIDVEIIEPLGFTFFDKYFSSLMYLGWKQPIDAIVFVTISFNGWLPNGSPAPRSFKNTWKCKVTGITVDVESSASKYYMKLVPLPMEALDSSNHIMDRGINSPIAETFEASIANLERFFNEIGTMRDPTLRLGLPDRIYQFRIGERLQELQGRMVTTLQPGRTTSALGPDGVARYSPTVGTTISDMLTVLALNIQNVAQVLNPSLDANFAEDFTRAAGTRLMQVLAVHPEVGYGPFDVIRNRYTRVLRYTIDLVYRPELENQPPNELGSRERAIEYIKQGLLRKRYDYLYTGQNTEVLDLKINFNTMYSQLRDNYSRQTPRSQAPNIDEETRRAETGQDIQFAKSNNLSRIFGQIGNFLSGNIFTGNLMETMPSSGILATLLNFREGPSVVPDFARRGVGTPMDNRQARNVEAAAEVDARANSRNAYSEFTREPITSMVEIKLGIRGDPYWLGVPVVARQDTPDVSNQYIGSPMLYLKFRLGEPHNEATGLTANLGKVTFNGIYYVTRIVSTFENGKFTQVLNCVMDTTVLGVEF
jgi:hypothetical protein